MFEAPSRLSARRKPGRASNSLFLKVHLYLGLTAAIFLVILGVTGSIMAFEGDIEHWLHPGLWYVTPGASALPQADLISLAERQFAPARVAAVQFSQQRNLVQIMQLNDRSAALVNPYNGAILGRLRGPTRIQKTLGFIHQLHLRLAMGAAGQIDRELRGTHPVPAGSNRTGAVVACEEVLDSAGRLLVSFLLRCSPGCGILRERVLMGGRFYGRTDWV
jgi:Uncharacterized iron-regulated membrane protein